MAVVAAQVTVTTTATQLSGNSDRGAPGISVAVRNRGTTSIFLGGPGVTTTTGFELAAGESATCDLAGDDELFGICAAGTNRADVLRTGT